MNLSLLVIAVATGAVSTLSASGAGKHCDDSALIELDMSGYSCVFVLAAITVGMSVLTMLMFTPLYRMTWAVLKFSRQRALESAAEDYVEVDDNDAGDNADDMGNYPRELVTVVVESLSNVGFFWGKKRYGMSFMIKIQLFVLFFSMANVIFMLNDSDIVADYQQTSFSAIINGAYLLQFQLLCVPLSIASVGKSSVVGLYGEKKFLVQTTLVTVYKYVCNLTILLSLVLMCVYYPFLLMFLLFTAMIFVTCCVQLIGMFLVYSLVSCLVSRVYGCVCCDSDEERAHERNQVGSCCRFLHVRFTHDIFPRCLFVHWRPWKFYLLFQLSKSDYNSPVLQYLGYLSRNYCVLDRECFDLLWSPRCWRGTIQRRISTTTRG